MQEVKFSIDPNVSMYEFGFSETEINHACAISKSREGYFQTWGYRIIKTDNGELQESVGIIVEADSGKTYMINPIHIIFPPNNAEMF